MLNEEEVNTRKKNQLTEYLAAISISLAILAGGTAYFFYDKWQNAQDQLAMMQMQDAVLTQNSYAANYNLEYKLKQSDEQIAMLLNSNTIKIELKGVGIMPASSASVFWNKDSSQVYILAKNLPEAPDDKQYQLWALKDGAPVDAGTFDRSDELQKMKNIDKAEIFKVTLGQKGGSTLPPADSVCVMGKI